MWGKDIRSCKNLKTEGTGRSCWHRYLVLSFMLWTRGPLWRTTLHRMVWNLYRASFIFGSQGVDFRPREGCRGITNTLQSCAFAPAQHLVLVTWQPTTLAAAPIYWLISVGSIVHHNGKEFKKTGKKYFWAQCWALKLLPKFCFYRT